MNQSNSYIVDRYTFIKYTCNKYSNDLNISLKHWLLM